MELITNKGFKKVQGRETIRFYTDSGLFKGWQYIDKTSYLEVQNWLRSGNTIAIGNNIFTSAMTNEVLFKYGKLFQ